MGVRNYVSYPCAICIVVKNKRARHKGARRLLCSQKKVRFLEVLILFVAISLRIFYLQDVITVVDPVEATVVDEERGSTKEEIAEKEGQGPGERPTVTIPSASAMRF